LSTQEKSDVLHAGTSIFVNRSIFDPGTRAKYGFFFFLWTDLANFVFVVDMDSRFKSKPEMQIKRND
jgi:hypothetical protein